tara:strand:- start:994 stop:1449 length:456 start_codon:yes stop_codon:yes gene_type:complete
MKAIEINGEIKVYNKLPNSWKGVMGNFSKLSEEEIQEYGFYDLIIPEYNQRTQELGEIYFENNKYYYKVLEKTWDETLDKLKEMKLNELNYNTKSKLKNTDWYYIRKLDRNIDVPQEVEDSRTTILNNHNEHETAINALTKKENVVKYEFE